VGVSPRRARGNTRRRSSSRRTAGHWAVGYIQIDGAKHAILRHHRQFDTFAAGFTAALLCPDTTGLRVLEPVRRVLDGTSFVTV
jgi:hypothetical protein